MGETTFNKKGELNMESTVKVWTRAERNNDRSGRLHKVIDYGNGKQVAIPVNKDGTVRWFDDEKLIRK